MSPTAPGPSSPTAPSSTDAGDPVDADRVAATVTALPEIAALATSGRVVVATYLPGRRVLGVRLDERSVTVAVVGASGAPVPAIAAAVRAALAPLVGARRVDVRVEDVVLSHEAGAASAATTRPAPA